MFTLLGSVVWLLGLIGSLLWPALIAFLFVRLQFRPLREPRRFLSIALPLSYAVVLISHGLLADVVLDGGREAAETGEISIAWSRILAVLLFESLLAVAALFLLRRLLDRRGKGPSA